MASFADCPGLGTLQTLSLNAKINLVAQADRCQDRPCTRCIKRNIGHLCHDEPREHELKKAKSSGSAAATTVDDSSDVTADGGGAGAGGRSAYDYGTAAVQAPGSQLVQQPPLSGLRATAMSGNTNQCRSSSHPCVPANGPPINDGGVCGARPAWPHDGLRSREGTISDRFLSALRETKPWWLTIHGTIAAAQPHGRQRPLMVTFCVDASPCILRCLVDGTEPLPRHEPLPSDVHVRARGHARI